MHTGDSCAYAKMTHKPVPKERSGKHANSPGGEVHTDLWGPCLVKPLGGKQYYISFTDDKNCYMQVYLLTLNCEAFKAYLSFKAWMKPNMVPGSSGYILIRPQQ